MKYFEQCRKKIRSYIAKKRAYLQSFRQKLHRRCTDYARTHRVYRRRRFNGHYTYTVVSAVYNVEPYLDDYFRSLTKQILDFKTHIHLILVDDGSTDGSADLIRRWQRRYPQNISYLYKENGGQGSARNAGLPLVKTPWVTFIDPDDFVDVSYFWHVDALLGRHHRATLPAEAIKLLSCNFYLYDERTKKYTNKHPLRDRFKKKESREAIGSLGKTIQMNVNAVFFPTENVRESGLSFTESRWGSAEDTDFVLRYLLAQYSGYVLYARYPRYYYRKRTDASSSLDTVTEKRAYYFEQLREGCLSILEQLRGNRKAIPHFLQQIILYQMSWRVKRFCGAPAPSFLSAEDVEEHILLCKKILSFLDPKIVFSFSGTHSCLQKWHKECIVAGTQEEPFEYTASIDRLNRKQAYIALSYYYKNEASLPQETFYVDGREVVPLEAKSVPKNFMGRPFAMLRLLYLPLPATKKDQQIFLDGKPLPLPALRGFLRVFLDGKAVHLSLGAQKAWAWSGSAVRTHFRLLPCPQASLPYADAWILMDRDTAADDNAEHLYRYIRAKHPEQRIFFALRSSSPHWERLKEEGFNLLNFGSALYECVLRGCAKLISSHMDDYVVNYYKNMLQNKQFICLKHGILSSDYSQRMNTRKIDLLFATTYQEYNSFVGVNSPYNLTNREVKLTGLARHDYLLKRAQEQKVFKKTLLVMPTWRKWLISKSKGKNKKLIMKQDFWESEYAQAWFGLLRSSHFLELVNMYEYSVQFLPHPMLYEYYSNINLDGINIISRNISIQDILINSSILLTDYSSISFEMALLRKPVLYYQFDEKDFFGGVHTYTLGYFDYRRDGFGPVITDERSLLEALATMLPNGAVPQSPYLERMEAALPFRDGKNCERIYQAILDLDVPLEQARDAAALP